MDVEDTPDFIVVAEREGSSMASVWNESVVVRRTQSDCFVLEICNYEVFSEFDPEDEEGNELPLPAEVGGEKVLGIMDGQYLYGGELSCYDADKSLSFSRTEYVREFEDNAAKQFSLTADQIKKVRRFVVGDVA